MTDFEPMSDEEFERLSAKSEANTHKLLKRTFYELRKNTPLRNVEREEALAGNRKSSDLLRDPEFNTLSEAKYKRALTDTEYITELFATLAASDAKIGHHAFWGHKSIFRKVLKRLIAVKKLDVEKILSRNESHNDLIVRKYGCMGCPYKGTKICPYGVGVKKAKEDEYDNWGELMTAAGNIIESHPKGICDERLKEFSDKFKLYAGLDGLKEARARALQDMSDFINLTEAKLSEAIALKSGGMITAQMDDAGEIVDLDIVTGLKTLSTLRDRFQDQLNKAIQQEEGTKQIVEKRLTADDLNDAMKRAKLMSVQKPVIDVKPATVALPDKV